IITVTPPAAEPVSRDEAKARLRVEHADEDTLIDDLIAAARERVERLTGRALIRRRVRETRDTVGEGGRLSAHGAGFELGLNPVSAVHHVKTYAADGADTVFAAENYVLDAASDPARLVLAGASLWPVPGRSAVGFEIEYDAGYGLAGADAPAPLREAILALVADAYEHRTPAERAEEVALPSAVRGLLEPFARMRL
ncbi:MAG: head-tail connector protein, partial [Caulobacterales bacterium]|nr:head-tail connector protein [Caulobacterales bacterium]